MVMRRRSAFKTTFEAVVGLALLTVGFLATLATLLGFFGSASWAFDALANFRFQYALLLIVVGALYGLMLSRGAAFLFIGVGLLNAFLVLPLYTGSPAEPRGADELTLVSFNVQAANPNRSSVLNWVDTSDADLVFFLESTEEWETAVANGDGTAGYTLQNEIPEDRRYGISVLGRSAVETETLRLTDRRDPVMRVTTELDNRPLIIYVVHPRSATSESGANARNELLLAVGELAADEADPVVVIGDLNATPWSIAFQDLKADADLINSQEGFGLQPTWPAGVPFGFSIPIDHMLHTSELTTTERSIGPALGSDHKPLMVTLKRSVS